MCLSCFEPPPLDHDLLKVLPSHDSWIEGEYPRPSATYVCRPGCEFCELDGLWALPSLIPAGKPFCSLVKVRDVRKLLGFFDYFRVLFKRDFAYMTAPLAELARFSSLRWRRSGRKVKSHLWTPEADHALLTLKYKFDTLQLLHAVCNCGCPCHSTVLSESVILTSTTLGEAPPAEQGQWGGEHGEGCHLGK